MENLILGIDDAGRGPVIGPMVIAGCLINSKAEKELKTLGVRDSKQLTQKRREFLENLIKEKSEDFEVVIMTPGEIDKSIEDGINLNQLEAIATAKVINRINKSDKKMKVVVDCPSSSIKNWTDFLRMKIEDLSNLEVVCEHKADRNHVAVSAASILAKSQREREIAKLKELYGDDLGSGYPSDPTTKKFLEKNVKNDKHGSIFRKSWKTWKNANNNDKQKKLI